MGNTSSLGIANRDGSDLRRVTPKGISGGDSYRNGPAWSADGRWIAFGSDGRRDSTSTSSIPMGPVYGGYDDQGGQESSPTWLPELPVRSWSDAYGSIRREDAERFIDEVRGDEP